MAHSSGNNLRRVVLEGEEGGNRRWKDDLRKNHSPFLCSLSSSSEKEPLRNVEAGAARVLRPIFILLDDEAEHRRVKKEEVEVPPPQQLCFVGLLSFPLLGVAGDGRRCSV